MARSLIRPSSAPQRRTVPLLGRSKAAAQCSNVLFPDPVGPITATNVAGGIDRLTPASAVIAPSLVLNLRPTRSSSTTPLTPRVSALLLRASTVPTGPPGCAQPHHTERAERREWSRPIATERVADLGFVTPARGSPSTSRPRRRLAPPPDRLRAFKDSLKAPS